ncbi:hypothetical protein KK083_19965 [Fulvivirgaceae bacterium PWU4]|uniref:BZIP transcription factor n=1 Tax=Chryseosolibacter histidini TaxID=2782349 RepID=A0AAP2DMR0_9BACT|nr:hypothetical protein [Chryseosolibacter histidini]MBT1699183.1 hypothetical protein [Chryseosolibacter histidini]
MKKMLKPLLVLFTSKTFTNKTSLLLLLTSFLTTAALAQVPSTDGTFTAVAPSDLKLFTGTNQRLTILNTTGFVGIGLGATSPTEMLHVNGNILATGSFSTSGSVTSSGNIASAATISATDFSASTGNFSSAGNFSFLTNGTPRLSVLGSNGFVGIGLGATSPSAMLHVNGDVLSTQYTAANGLFNSSGNLSLATNGSARLSVLNSNGFVGIGIASPAQMLHINGGNIVLDNGTPTLFTGAGDADHHHYLRIANSTERANPSGLKTGGILIADNFDYAAPGQNDLIVKGKISVGTPLTNTYELAVNGKIGAKDVKIERSSAAWPDYVFATSYRLPSLSEVEKYIQANHHLQDVPSAEEVEKNGHSLGDMDAVLLKKVEELTLYIIEQQKQIDALKQQLEKK